jgi:hypothetical protein
MQGCCKFATFDSVRLPASLQVTRSKWFDRGKLELRPGPVLSENAKAHNGETTPHPNHSMELSESE